MDPSLGRRFRDSIRLAINEIRSKPRSCSYYVDDVRRKVLFDFPYLIFYTATQRRLTIVAVMHQSREPDYWKKRRN
ncbi:MAG: type II toxin-antitoxin system RelE/ParE family toxin [Acidobacteria bacterium]|nr:type II toxin-antitoxin system RelE/ParE family toxin [Acidobacteriota bacterium]